jgi:hypothetical protein
MRERKRKSFIERERELGEIQNEEGRELTGDSTCCLRDSKDIYLYT